MYISLVLMMEVWAREREKTMFNETKITTLNLSFPLLFRKIVFYVTVIYNIPLTWDETHNHEIGLHVWEREGRVYKRKERRNLNSQMVNKSLISTINYLYIYQLT